jgi:hypothetical protein
MIVEDLRLVLLPVVVLAFAVAWFARFLGSMTKGRFQFNLRNLMLLTTAAAILAAGTSHNRSFGVVAFLCLFVVFVLWLFCMVFGHPDAKGNRGTSDRSTDDET